MLDHVSNFLNFSDIMGLVGVALALFAIHLQIKDKKRPCYAVLSQTIVSDANSILSGLHVIFKGIPQDRVTVSRIIFWNDGRDAIKCEDISKASPIRVAVAPGAEVLSCSLLGSASDTNGVHIHVSETEPTPSENYEIYVDFEFLNYGDGFVLDIIHNGPFDHQIALEGTIIGANPLRQLRLLGAGDEVIGFRISFWVIICMVAVMLAGSGFLKAAKGTVLGNNAFWVALAAGVVFYYGRKAIDVRSSPSVPAKLRAVAMTGIRSLYHG